VQGYGQLRKARIDCEAQKINFVKNALKTQVLGKQGRNLIDVTQSAEQDSSEVDEKRIKDM
jgi:hypothetical protein